MCQSLQVILAYIVADFLAALYHLMTDRGWNIASQVRYFTNHHDKPWTMTFDLQPVLGGVPVALIGYFVWPWFFVSLGAFLAFAQIPHYYTHHAAPRIVQALQRSGLILRPTLHNRHHRVSFDRDFCVLNGWTNRLVNAIAPFVPART